jgi:hypothetical protein
MLFDGTQSGLFENQPLGKLAGVERLLATEQQWCKGKLRDNDGRHCLVGAMQAVEARRTLEPIILRAAREVGGKRYWRIELFNDDPHTTHADVMRVLRRARENIITGMAEGDQHQPWSRRLAQALRAFSGSVSEVCAVFRLGPGEAPALALQPIAVAVPPRDRKQAARERCEVP